MALLSGLGWAEQTIVLFGVNLEKRSPLSGFPKIFEKNRKTSKIFNSNKRAKNLNFYNFLQLLVMEKRAVVLKQKSYQAVLQLRGRCRTVELGCWLGTKILVSLLRGFKNLVCPRVLSVYTSIV